MRVGRTADSDDLGRRAGGHRDVLYSGLLVLAGKKADLRFTRGWWPLRHRSLSYFI